MQKNVTDSSTSPRAALPAPFNRAPAVAVQDSDRCPCCAGQLIRQIQNNQLDWFCLTCRQTMPNLGAMVALENAVPPDAA